MEGSHSAADGLLLLRQNAAAATIDGGNSYPGGALLGLGTYQASPSPSHLIVSSAHSTRTTRSFSPERHSRPAQRSAFDARQRGSCPKL